MWGKENFLKKVFFPPHPLSFKNFETRGIFLFSDIVRSTLEPPMFALHPRLKVFGAVVLNIYTIGGNSLKFAIAMNDIGCRHCRLFFKKLARVWGE